MSRLHLSHSSKSRILETHNEPSQAALYGYVDQPNPNDYEGLPVLDGNPPPPPNGGGQKMVQPTAEYDQHYHLSSGRVRDYSLLRMLKIA